MKTAGIIAEYNPFHNGHKLHIERTRREAGADYVVVVMSGSFVQRGEPALTDKYARARMALLSGADLVLELPVLFSAGSAGDFAMGAVSLLDKLGTVDVLSFGSECGDVDSLCQAAKLLAEEPAAFSEALQNGLRQGKSFPAARMAALCACMPVPDADGLFGMPNNILGLEYCRALHVRKSAIRPFTIKREGAGYHDAALHAGEQVSSATALRHALQADDVVRDKAADAALLQKIAPFIPQDLYPVWQDLLCENRLLFPKDFTKELRYRLLLEREEGFLRYADVTRELSDKLRKSCLDFQDWDMLCGLLKSREITYSRISRALCRILLGITQEELERARKGDYVPYARMLGFRQSAAPLLSAIKKNSAIPLLPKLADAQRLLPGDALSMLQKDILAAHLYGSALSAKNGKPPENEYTRRLVLV